MFSIKLSETETEKIFKTDISLKSAILQMIRNQFFCVEGEVLRRNARKFAQVGQYNPFQFTSGLTDRRFVCTGPEFRARPQLVTRYQYSTVHLVPYQFAIFVLHY